jgi:hypothetical protein
MTLNETNLIVVTTTLANDLRSLKRNGNLISAFNKYNVPILFNHGYKNIDKTLNYCTFEQLNLFKKSNFNYGLICENDFFPINNFLEELNLTINLLPRSWECLHLCPGFLWGKFFNDLSKIGKLNSPYDIRHLEYHKSGRYYLNCTPQKYINTFGWLGGPIAFIVNKLTIDKFLYDYYIYYKDHLNEPNDVILTNILNSNQYICREPMMGYEKEEGGSTF